MLYMYMYILHELHKYILMIMKIMNHESNVPSRFVGAMAFGNSCIWEHCWYQ